MIRKILALIIFSFAILNSNLNFAATQKIQPMISNPEVQEFIQHMVKHYQFDQHQLTKLFNQTYKQQSIIDRMEKPYEALPWYKYKKLFITKSHIEKGVKFWQDNQKALALAEQKYGVPPEIIIAIHGVETRYGTHKGKDQVFESLATLAFEYPKRAKFFKKELEEFLLLAKEQNWDPASIRGSYAGAMGNPQFIPSSYRQYAVDFNNNGKRDLINSIEDSIGSVANYFAMHGWQKNQPVIEPAIAKGDGFKNIKTSNNNPKPSYTYQELTKNGLNFKDSNFKLATKAQNLALISLEEQDSMDHYIAMNNFYVITRYNHSKHYAKAVYDLSQAIKQAYGNQKT